jgi:hypothetical protein
VWSAKAISPNKAARSARSQRRTNEILMNEPDNLSPILPGTSKLTRPVFISYSRDDSALADLICAALEADGIRCWIAPREGPAKGQANCSSKGRRNQKIGVYSTIDLSLIRFCPTSRSLDVRKKIAASGLQLSSSRISPIITMMSDQSEDVKSEQQPLDFALLFSGNRL